MGGILSPEFVQEFQHVRWHIYASGTPEDARQKQNIAQENAIIVQGEVIPTKTHMFNRVEAALGSRVGDVVKKMKYDKDGSLVTYGKGDLTYDINKKYILLQY